MFKPKDLRFGNIVLIDNLKYHPKLKDVPMVVKSISRNWSMDEITENYAYKYYCGLDKLEPGKYDIENYSQFLGFLKPIALDEKWLLKLGFTKEINEDDFDYWLIDEFDNDFLWEHSNGFCYNFGKGYEINFVHQLQNLYFSLTGDELSL